MQHSGGLNGYRTFLKRNLDDNSGYIILTNHGNQTNLLPILRALDAILEGETYEMPRVPVSSKLSKLIDDKDVISAIDKINELLKSTPNRYEIDEVGVNALGYEYFGNGDLNTAMAIFEFNVEKNPKAFNTYDSLGEIHRFQTSWGRDSAGMEVGWSCHRPRRSQRCRWPSYPKPGIRSCPRDPRSQEGCHPRQSSRCAWRPFRPPH